MDLFNILFELTVYRQDLEVHQEIEDRKVVREPQVPPGFQGQQDHLVLPANVDNRVLLECLDFR